MDLPDQWHYLCGGLHLGRKIRPKHKKSAALPRYAVDNFLNIYSAVLADLHLDSVKYKAHNCLPHYNKCINRNR